MKKDKNNISMTDDVEECIETSGEVLMLNQFLKNNKKTSGEHNSYSAGFKTWLFVKDKNLIDLRKTESEWNKLLEDFLSSPVK